MTPVSFAVPGDAYDRFVGRYSRQLAPRFLDFAGVERGPVLEVGCGPGALTAVLAARFGPADVAAVEPSDSFAAACRARVPGADVRAAGAESLPFPDDAFGAVLSQLVLSFVGDAPRAMAEMLRVVRPGGAVAACTFAADGFALVGTFWRAALRLDPAAPDDASLPFRDEESLLALWRQAGLRDISLGRIELEARYEDFDDCWQPLAVGIGPTGAYLLRQSPARRDELREGCRELLGRPTGPFRGAGGVRVAGRRWGRRLRGESSPGWTAPRTPWPERRRVGARSDAPRAEATRPAWRKGGSRGEAARRVATRSSPRGALFASPSARASPAGAGVPHSGASARGDGNRRRSGPV